jgi:hypothetical protein
MDDSGREGQRGEEQSRAEREGGETDGQRAAGAAQSRQLAAVNSVRSS